MHVGRKMCTKYIVSTILFSPSFLTALLVDHVLVVLASISWNAGVHPC